MRFTDKVLKNWQPDFRLRKSVYLRDTIVNNLLCCASKKGTHSFAYDYRSSVEKAHKSKVIGYYPVMSIAKARERVQEIHKKVKAGQSYDEVFEIVRTPSTIYFLENSQGYIKIGHSVDWLHRIKELVFSTEGIRLIGVRTASKDFSESRLHWLYRKYRQRSNEYFNDRKGYIKQMITEAVVYNATDRELVVLMGQQERLIYK